jgi:Uma2 family endonuclease
MTPQTQLSLHSIDLTVYHGMIEHGLLSEDDKVELISGKIVTMSPKGSRHAACLRKIMTWLPKRVGSRAQIQVQDPIQIPELSEPEPDLALVRPRADFYADRHPLPEEVLLIIEIADSSLDYDRNIKAPLYAAAGIPAYWIINLPEGVIEQHTQPLGDRYKAVRIMERGERLSLPASDLEVWVEDWLV